MLKCKTIAIINNTTRAMVKGFGWDDNILLRLNDSGIG